MMTSHGALFVSAISDVSVFRSDDISFQGPNVVYVAFKVERTGDVSKKIQVKYVVKNLGIEDDSRTFTGSVDIEAGKSSAEFRVPITTLQEIGEDGLNQEATVILQAGTGYNVVYPATATFRLHF
jgi:hypothetical protein